jgi:hypothetical protein
MDIAGPMMGVPKALTCMISGKVVVLSFKK